MRPVFRPILEAFEPLFSQRKATAEKLAPLMADANIALNGVPADQPLLTTQLPEGLGPFVRMAADDLLPLLLGQKPIAPHEKDLKELFTAPDRILEDFVAAQLAEDPVVLQEFAKDHGIDPAILQFVGEFVVSAVLRALVLPRTGEEYGNWRQGICPVCGSPPVIAWLGRRPILENNEYLADGGGKKHLHCSICGSDWYFLRGVCPACGIHGKDAMHILGEEDRRHERIDWCKKCHTYLPQTDLRELAEIPDMDALALCMMHLDLVAAEKKLIPLKASFWNNFQG